MMLDAFVSFWTLAIILAGTGLLGVVLAIVEEWRGHGDAIAFDLIRALTITALGWSVVAVATMLDPVRMGAAVFVPPTVMATATFLMFLIQAVGWACFMVFRWQSLRGTHPWQRQRPVRE